MHHYRKVKLSLLHILIARTIITTAEELLVPSFKPSVHGSIIDTEDTSGGLVTPLEPSPAVLKTASSSELPPSGTSDRSFLASFGRLSGQFSRPGVRYRLNHPGVRSRRRRPRSCEEGSTCSGRSKCSGRVPACSGRSDIAPRDAGRSSTEFFLAGLF